MKQKSFKIIVSLLAGITLGSTIIGSSMSIANASENYAIVQTKEEDMSKYYTEHYDSKTNITSWDVSDSQYGQYLLDHGVPLKDIPKELFSKKAHHHKFISVKFYGNKHHGNFNIYISARAMRDKYIGKFVLDFALSIYDAYKMDYWESIKDFMGSISDIVDGAHTHHGKVIYFRHGHYHGSRSWD